MKGYFSSSEDAAKQAAINRQIERKRLIQKSTWCHLGRIPKCPERMSFTLNMIMIIIRVTITHPVTLNFKKCFWRLINQLTWTIKQNSNSWPCLAPTPCAATQEKATVKQNHNEHVTIPNGDVRYAISTNLVGDWAKTPIKEPCLTAKNGSYQTFFRIYPFWSGFTVAVSWLDLQP